MKKSVLKAWRGVLNSDHPSFQEGSPEILRQGNCYSAFGILCEIYRVMTGKGSWQGYPTIPMSFEGEAVIPPEEVRVWADMTAVELNELSGKNHRETRKWLKKYKAEKEAQQDLVFALPRAST